MTGPAATLALRDAARRRWDALVVGAGPAGALAAHQLARAGADVLLVDKAPFPRWKICGCCLNAGAVRTLVDLGLGTVLSAGGASPLTGVRLAAGPLAATVPTPPGAALSRAALDAGLARAAVQRGADFLPGCAARLEPPGGEAGVVVLRAGAVSRRVRASVVLAADGLGGQALRDHSAFAVRSAPAARVGAAAIVARAPDEYAPGTIYMAVASGGYAGLVRLEDGRLNVAAALDPTAVRAAGGLGRAVAGVLDAAPRFVRIPGLAAAGWRGTPPLTCRRGALAAERVFVVGDAAGYVEPFTGEGIAWALASGVAVAPLALQAADGWRPDLAAEWAATSRALLRVRQRRCRALTSLLRLPLAASALVGVLGALPGLAGPVVRAVSASPVYRGAPLSG